MPRTATSRFSFSAWRTAAPPAAPVSKYGADAFLGAPFEPVELIAQVNALLRIKERHDQLSAKASETQRINKRLQAAYQQIDQELELARRVQESFLPQTLPQLPQVRFAVKYRPCGRVGGDFYDVFRLDEQHLGLYVADAMGHGVPASLLTIFVKTSVKAKEIHGQSYRLVPPDEVLERLNRDLIDAGPFGHAVHHHGLRAVQLARPASCSSRAPAIRYPLTGAARRAADALADRRQPARRL